MTAAGGTKHSTEEAAGRLTPAPLWGALASTSFLLCWADTSLPGSIRR